MSGTEREQEEAAVKVMLSLRYGDFKEIMAGVIAIVENPGVGGGGQSHGLCCQETTGGDVERGGALP